MIPEHEEDPHIGPVAGWLAVVGLCAAILAWGVFNYMTIRDTPRQWDFGVLPDVPGQSIYSTSEGPTSQPIGPQIAPLPEANRTPASAPASMPASKSADVPDEHWGKAVNGLQLGMKVLKVQDDILTVELMARNVGDKPVAVAKPSDPPERWWYYSPPIEVTANGKKVLYITPKVSSSGPAPYGPPIGGSELAPGKMYRVEFQIALGGWGLAASSKAEVFYISEMRVGGKNGGYARPCP